MYQKITIGWLVRLGLLLPLSSWAIAGDESDNNLENYQRFALVIGNKNYEPSSYYHPLINPIKDAEAIRGFLIKSGFKSENIIYADDATLKETKDVIDDFVKLIEAKKSVAFVYYGGHGTQDISLKTGQKTNYLIPIDNKKIQSASGLDNFSISLNDLMIKLSEINHGLNIVLIDACRNELPITEKSSPISSIPSIPAKGLFIAYATASENTAADNGKFRTLFIEQASSPQKLTDVFTQVKKILYEETGQSTIVVDRTNGKGDFYLTGSEEDTDTSLKANYLRAKNLDKEALSSLQEGDKYKDSTEYRKAWLYGLEAKKLKMPEGKIALKQSTLNQLTDLSLKVLNPERQAISRFLDINDPVKTISYSPDGSTLALGSDDNTIKLWDIQTEQLKQTLHGHQDRVTFLTYSPDGSTLASGSEDNTIKLWNVKTGQLQQTLKGHEKSITSLSYDPDGNMLVSGSNDKSIKFWDSKTGQLKQTLEGHEGGITSLSYSPNGDVLASGATDKTIKLWDAKTRQLKKTLKGHEGDVFALSYSPNGNILASGSKDKTIKLWDNKTGELKQTLQGHRHAIYTLSYSPDGLILASGSGDKTIRLWDTQTGQPKQILEEHEGRVTSLNYSPNGHFLVSESADNTIKIWDTQTWQLSQTLSQYKDEIASLSYNLDGSTLASEFRGEIQLWNPQSGKLKKTLKGHKKEILSLSYSPDESIFASGSQDKTIKIWDANTGQLKQTLKRHEDSVTSLSYSPDGRTLASGSQDKTIKLWDIKKGKLTFKKTLQEGEEEITSLSYSPNSITLASGLSGGKITLWDMQTGQPQQTFQGHEGPVSALSYSPDGNILASGSWDETIKLWDTQTGQLKQTLQGHKDQIFSLSYSPDGKTLASASYDGTIKLWDSQTGQLKQTLQGDENATYFLSYSPDGILTSSGKKGIKRWTSAMLQTQALFNEYDIHQVSIALQFLWEMGLDDDGLTFVYKDRKSEYFSQERYYTELFSLLDDPADNKTKAAQLIQWLEARKVFKK